MIQFKPIEPTQLPALPMDWKWFASELRHWQVFNPFHGRIWLDSDGDLILNDYYALVPRLLIKALYVANGVEL
jgi:hypothetical protein